MGDMGTRRGKEKGKEEEGRRVARITSTSRV
jgi:hypothetical protein